MRGKFTLMVTLLMTDGASPLRTIWSIILPMALRHGLPEQCPVSSLTVAENIGFALKLRKLPKDQLKTTVGEADLVEALGSELVIHFTIDAHRVLAEGAADKDHTATGQAIQG